MKRNHFSVAKGTLLTYNSSIANGTQLKHHSEVLILFVQVSYYICIKTYLLRPFDIKHYGLHLKHIHALW